MRATVIGIAGCTNAGKSTLAGQLNKELSKKGASVKIVEQDEYYYTKEKVNEVQSITDPSISFYDYDKIQALDVEKIANDAKKFANNVDFLIVEGSMITEIFQLYDLMDVVLFLTMDKEHCIERRDKRTYDPPDLPGYFEQLVWPSYETTLQNAKSLDSNGAKLQFVPYTEIISSSIQYLIKSRLRNALNLLRIQENVINVEETIQFVNESNCGAISTFIGTTRDNFESKNVTYLKYECYAPMAYSELRTLCRNARNRFPIIERIAIFHRIGEVKVKEASVAITTSSPQRTDAIAATEFLINELKHSVPIWKKEAYSDGTFSWKENNESIHQVIEEHS